MSTPELVGDLATLPLGSHCLGLHVGEDEAAQHAAAFLAGAPTGQPAAYWVPDTPAAELCRQKVAARAPEHLGCVAILSHEQVGFVDGHLRPTQEIVEFARAHPDGFTGGAETISRYWGPGSIPEHLEYESWFEAQPRDRCRFLCPYDLRMIPPHLAPTVLRDLGAHHSHVALSDSVEPAAALLQLFVFPTEADVPTALLPVLDDAFAAGLLVSRGPPGEFALSRAGGDLVQAWWDPVTHAPAAAPGLEVGTPS